MCAVLFGGNGFQNTKREVVNKKKIFQLLCDLKSRVALGEREVRETQKVIFQVLSAIISCKPSPIS